MGISLPESHESNLYTELEIPHLHISLNVFRDLGGAGEGWGQKSLLTLWHGKSCHTLGFKASCWFVEMQTLLSVPASVSPLSWSLASQWNVSPHSNYFIFSPALFFWLGIVPQDCPLFSKTQMLLPSDRQRQSCLIDKILLDKILVKCHLPSEFNPNITPDSGTMTFWHQPT